MTTTLHEVLADLVTQCSPIQEVHWPKQGATWYDGSRLVSSKQYNEKLAPIIERALRAAYRIGVINAMTDAHGISDNGVTAGVAAMVEDA